MYEAIAQALWAGIEWENTKIRLLGITLSNLDTEIGHESYKQLSLDLQPYPGSISQTSDIDWS